MKTENIKVENIKCHGCANTIQKELMKIDGVKDVEVMVEDQSVKIDYESDQDLKDKFIKKLRRLGYPEQGTGNTMARVKSYASCAYGRVKL